VDEQIISKIVLKHSGSYSKLNKMVAKHYT
jgi:hypothetical protein